VALLLWVYYSAQVFFLGAEFTRQYATRFGSLRDRAPERPNNARDDASTRSYIERM
jgi:membrane protein